MNLIGKVAVVTGGSRDIGRAIAIELASQGARVVVNYLNSEAEAKATVATIVKAGGEALAVKADVSSLEAIGQLKHAVQKAYGDTIDILVNNAGGLFARKTLENFDEAFYDLVKGVNFKSAVFVTQAFASMLSKGSTVINISS